MVVGGCGQDRARRLGVAIHLRHQGGEVGELDLVAQFGDELDLDTPTVQVAVEIEQMGFKQRLLAASAGRRPGTCRLAVG